MEKIKNNISYTLHNNLCTGCGICVGACPSQAISIEVRNGRFLPIIDKVKCKNDRGCHRCFDACPGVGIDLIRIAKEQFSNENIKENSYLGYYLKCYTGWSKNIDIRKSASSGGVLSQFLIWLIENKHVDGVVVSAFDKDAPLKVRTFIATTKEEILTAKGSKYAPVSFHEVSSLIKNAPGSKYVIVGLPCHIQGLRKLTKLDHKLKDKILGMFSLFCSGSQTFNYTEYIMNQCGGDINSLNYLSYREGSPSGMVAKGDNFNFFKKYEEYNKPLKSTFYPRRCLLCVDMFGELADINFGDIHMDNPSDAGVGINAIIVRNSSWHNLLQQAFEEGAISLEEISIERMLYKRPMAYAKKRRNASFVRTLKKIGKEVPNYDSKYESQVSTRIFARYIIMRTKQFIGSHKCLWPLIKKIK